MNIDFRIFINLLRQNNALLPTAGSYPMRVSEGLQTQWHACTALPADNDAPRTPALLVAGERCTQPSLAQKQDSFPQLTVVLRTDFYFKFEGPMQGRFLNWCVIARVQSWLECEKPF